MRVLMISGDQNLVRLGTSAHERFLLQKNAVEALELVVWPKQFLKPFFVSGKFDVVTSQDPFWRGLVAWVAARRLHARFNVQVHADIDAQSFVKHVLGQIVLMHADSVRAVSSRVEKQVLTLTRAKVGILPVFIDLTRFQNLAHEPHSRFAKTILWTGRFEPEKDPLDALEVLRRVRAAGADAGLVMLGEGSLMQALKEKAASDGLEEYVEFPGWQDPLRFLKQADVLLCTSRAESFGASMVEALAAGVPVVSSDVGIAREAGAIIRDKKDLSAGVLETLSNGRKGTLLLPLLSKEEWADEWKKSLQ
ncbi:MAG TPA: glycosyltransferase [Candidatus Paceibacterota bacterium]|nr:glycosyltransferase [Candidatus Paceibacterota bacterium]